MSTKINFVEKPQVLIDAALNRGRKSSMEYPKQKTEFYTINGKEMAKIDASANYLEEKLFKASSQFPSFEELDPFYHDLYECIIDVPEMKKTLSSLSSVGRLIKKIRRDHLVKIKELRYSRGREKQALEVTKSYIGRMASLIKGIGKHIEYYNESARKLNELPSVRTNEECIILAGFPNVGKSTLLKKITESKPEIANYPFTTKGLNVGVFMMRYLPIQVIDTPGLLDRPLHERNKIELKAITALQYLKGILAFVVDPTDDLDVQKSLLIEIKKLFTKHKFMVVITKSDIANESQVENAKKKFEEYDIVIDGADKTALKDYFLAKGKKLFEGMTTED
ncbi:MAG: GTPase [archaeon]|jgi:nucleolar GTP-binding protein